jgi:pyruvate dehydrogenase E2 component (dihydrolipoamide acetyltransferase)
VAFEIKMPKLGMTMEEGQIVEWLKAEKSAVAQGEILFVIESDKVTYEVEANDSGILAIITPPGEVVKVGTVVGFLAVNETEYQAKTSSGGTSAVAPAAAEATTGSTATIGVAATTGGRVRATPGARSLAKKRGLALATVRGTGPHGRVTREDVIQAIEKPTATAAPEAPVTVPAPIVPGKSVMKEERLAGMRATISRRMMDSLQNSAQMTAFTEWDVTELMQLRKTINAAESRFGFRATIPGMLTYFLGRVLKEMPLLNASIDGNSIQYWAEVNVGVAVAVADGLVVPVVHSAHRRDLRDIQQVLADLIERARSKKLTPADMSGGTFTLSNLGSYGSDWETVILNPPEVALLGIGRMTKKPVVIEEEIVIRQMMPISLTFDHRLIDGAAAGEFRNRMKELVENPGLLMTCLSC